MTTFNYEKLTAAEAVEVMKTGYRVSNTATGRSRRMTRAGVHQYFAGDEVKDADFPPHAGETYRREAFTDQDAIRWMDEGGECFVPGSGLRIRRVAGNQEMRGAGLAAWARDRAVMDNRRGSNWYTPINQMLVLHQHGTKLKHDEAVAWLKAGGTISWGESKGTRFIFRRGEYLRTFDAGKTWSAFLAPAFGSSWSVYAPPVCEKPRTLFEAKPTVVSDWVHQSHGWGLPKIGTSVPGAAGADRLTPAQRAVVDTFDRVMAAPLGSKREAAEGLRQLVEEIAPKPVGDFEALAVQLEGLRQYGRADKLRELMKKHNVK